MKTLSPLLILFFAAPVWAQAIPYADRASAEARSEALALSRGAGDDPGDVTRYWFSVVDSTLGPSTAAMILSGDPDLVLDELVRADQFTAHEMAYLVSGRYAPWTPNTDYSVGDLRSFQNRLYEVVQAHTSQAGWQPPSVPALWTPVSPEGVVSGWVQPTGAHDAYDTGERVIHPFPGGSVWESLVDANVWAPAEGSLWTEVQN